MTRHIAVSSEQAAAVTGAVVTHATGASGTAVAIEISPPIIRPRPSERSDRRVGESSRRSDARRATPGSDHCEQSDAHRPDDDPRSQGSAPDDTTNSGGASPWSTNPSASARPSFAPGTIAAAAPRSETIVASTKSCAAPDRASQRRRGEVQSPVRAAGSTTPSCWRRRTMRQSRRGPRTTRKSRSA